MPDLLQAKETEHFVVVVLKYSSLVKTSYCQSSVIPEDTSPWILELSKDASVSEIAAVSSSFCLEFFSAVTSVKDSAHAIVHLLSRQIGKPLDELRPALEVIVDSEAVAYLFRRAGGLSSFEKNITEAADILQSAYRQSCRLGTSKKVFSILFPAAFSAAGRIRDEIKEKPNTESRIVLAEEILAEELNRLGPWPLPLHAGWFTSHLGELADRVCQTEMEGLFDLLPDLTLQQKQEIQTQMKHLAERILLAPRLNIRNHETIQNCADSIRCLSELFTTDCGSRASAMKKNEK